MGKPAGLARVVAFLRAFLPATTIKDGGVQVERGLAHGQTHEQPSGQ